jgi:hypothetical protein
MRILGGGLLAAIVLGGCFTGQRPSFDETVSAATATGEPSIDAVLERLDAVQGSLFTAEYEIVGANGDRSTATVVQAGGGRRAVTVDDVRYVITGDSGITRLRVDADRRIQDPTPFTEQVDGRSSTCALVPVSGGEKTYCALDAGPLARYIGPDVDIRLVGFSAEPDVTQIAAP